MSKKTEQDELIRRLRFGNLRTLFRHRYGPTFPNDDAGREDLRELLLPISLGLHASIKMENAIEVWAPWMSKDEAAQLIDDINQMAIWKRKPKAGVLGQRQNLTHDERERLRLRTIAACDKTPEEAAQLRKAKDRARKQRYRQAQGATPRSESLSQKKPWKETGKSRAQWYRDQRKRCETHLSETDSSEVKLPKERTKLSHSFGRRRVSKGRVRRPAMAGEPTRVRKKARQVREGREAVNSADADFNRSARTKLSK
jgi:hypothetical protein